MASSGRLERICGCPQCAPPLCNFSGCVVKSIFGRVRSVHCPALKKVRGALTQTGALTEFSETLAADCVYAAKVAEDQAGVEGPYWLALLLTPSFETEVECVFAGDVIEAGFLVVKVILSNLLLAVCADISRSLMYLWLCYCCRSSGSPSRATSATPAQEWTSDATRCFPMSTS